MTAAQLDLFADNPTPARDADVVGLPIVMPTLCPRCYGVTATIGAGRGPHRASLMCGCGCHLGWMSAETFSFITAIVRQFGRPTEPIKVRFNTAQTAQTNGAVPSGASTASEPMHPEPEKETDNAWNR